MEELKPRMFNCPFCGEDYARFSTRTEENHRSIIAGKEDLQTRSERFKIYCSGCGCGTGWHFYKEDAIAAWNTRAGAER